MAENQLVEEWLRAARQADYSLDNAAQVAATIALAEGVKWIGESLAELVEMVRESEAAAHQLPCNEMGGGSSGLDTADDFAMHCNKPDKHDGPHSYEEDGDGKELHQ